VRIPLKARSDSEGKRALIPKEKAGSFRQEARLDSGLVRVADPVRNIAWIPQARARSLTLA
jgi:hypothetical protein